MRYLSDASRALVGPDFFMRYLQTPLALRFEMGEKKKVAGCLWTLKFTELFLSTAVADVVGKFYREEEYKEILWSLWSFNCFKLEV